jgi:hypothetical protein
MSRIVGIPIHTPIIPRTTDTGIIDPQNTITDQMAEFTIINDLNFAMAGSIKNSTPVDIISGRVTSKVEGAHDFGTMPAVELVLAGICAAASGDAIDIDPGQGRLGMRKGAANRWVPH